MAWNEWSGGKTSCFLAGPRDLDIGPQGGGFNACQRQLHFFFQCFLLTLFLFLFCVYIPHVVYTVLLIFSLLEIGRDI